MRKGIVFCAATLAAMTVFGPDAQAQAPTPPMAPVEAFADLPFVSSPHLSPDGNHIAMIQPVNGRPAAVIMQAHPAPGAQPSVLQSGEYDILDIAWANDRRVILIVKIVSKSGYEDRVQTRIRAIALDIDGGNAVALMRNMPYFGNNTNTATIVDMMPDDPDHVLMSLYNAVVKTKENFNTRIKEKKDQDFRLDLIEVDVNSGKGTVFKQGSTETVRWYGNGQGNALARIDRSQRMHRDTIVLYSGDEWRAAGSYEISGDSGTGLLGLIQDGSALAIHARNDSSFEILTKRGLKDTAESPLFSVPGYDVEDAIHDEWTGRVIGARYTADSPKAHFFDPKLQALQNGLEKAFPGRSVVPMSWSKDRNKVIVAVDGPQMPTTYFLLDRLSHKMDTLASAYPKLKPADLGAMKPYPYTARDGLAIPAYLTLPPGKDAKNLPVVVMPHGGPDARDAIGFDWMAQFLANRGYAVLQPNFRGSHGYGFKFTQAGFLQWGLKMQDDITDGVKKMIADGIADPKRICIVGASYGGYAALAGAAFTPKLYACAASWAGVSDLPLAVHDEYLEHGNQSQIFDFWGARMGSADVDKLVATSPARHAKQIRIPVLLMHGKGDTTVRFSQGEAMAEAMNKAGAPVRFIPVEGEDHYMTSSATRLLWLSELEKFLARHIGR